MKPEEKAEDRDLKPEESRAKMNRKNDLRKRTKKYAAAVIRLYCALPRTRAEVQVVGRQMLRSGTSVAANYREASRARSDADFISKIEVCAQEADETSLWLELLAEECAIRSDLLTALLKETDELIAIFVTMAKKVKTRRSQSAKG